MCERETTPPEQLISCIEEVMSNPNYLKGQEPEGSGWDFCNWEGKDFTPLSSEVRLLKQKEFSIPTLDEDVSIVFKIMEFNGEPEDFDGRKLYYVVKTVSPEDLFPAVMVMKSTKGEKIIIEKQIKRGLDQKTSDLILQGDLNKYITENKNTAAMIIDILRNRDFFPEDLWLAEEQVRNQLNIDAYERITEKDQLEAIYQLTMGEILNLLYVSFFFNA
jgi:hypothetical protein